MQKVCPCPGGIKKYLESPRCLLDDETRKCPWCRSEHRLRIHGDYERYAILPGNEEPSKIAVLRLLYPRKRRTVSLLPDFCLPRRQYGPAIVGIFVYALSKGAELLKAMREARPDCCRHCVPQSLLKGFLRRESRIKTYLARVRPRAVDPPPGTPQARRRLAILVWGLLDGSTDVESVFTHHARRFHARFTVGLA